MFVFNRSVLLRKARTWFHQPLPVKLWLLPAFLMLGLVRMSQFVLPFRRLAPWLGVDLRTSACVPLTSTVQTERAVHVGRAIAIAAHYTPCDSQCLVQAIAARALLGMCRIPCVLFLGVGKSDTDQLLAHAWVCSGPVVVTGGRDTGAYAIVGTFFAGAPMPEESLSAAREFICRLPGG